MIILLAAAAVGLVTMNLTLVLSGLIGAAGHAACYSLAMAFLDMADAALLSRKDEAARIAREAMQEARQREDALDLL
ncbi:hypothetical protein HNR46_001310 [Haloferula luteola]|uniref:Uncharacterized protein n=1 Tax=Haloferula luteola TaxID=595692 RepID=A0A840V200_9BACT|nr:hypothetical protein [Haloferula luteola]MBB5351076.1 hypothetical protein [Haloferula luteola]